MTTIARTFAHRLYINSVYMLFPVAVMVGHELGAAFRLNG